MDRRVKILKKDGSILDGNLITYLISDNHAHVYLVYSKGEKHGETDNIIYISKVIKKDSDYFLEEIFEDNEWKEVQHLLKKIANA